MKTIVLAMAFILLAEKTVAAQDRVVSLLEKMDKRMDNGVSQPSNVRTACTLTGRLWSSNFVNASRSHPTWPNFVEQNFWLILARERTKIGHVLQVSHHRIRFDVHVIPFLE